MLGGEEVWFHDGQMREHRTEICMFPSKQFGVVIMANADTPAINIVLWKVIYDFLKVPQEQRLDFSKRSSSH